MDSKIAKINIKKTTIRLIQQMDMICITLAIIIVLVATAFLYNNCYRSIQTAKVVSVLKKQVAFNVVDMELWGEINQEIKWKQQELQGNTLEINPFE